MTEMPDTLADGFAFIEGPRWRDGALWFSDMHGHKVYRMVPGESAEVVATLEGSPSGLGWLPDGRMLIVSMLDKRLLQREADGTLVEHADLSAIAPQRINDMVVDDQGRAYVGNFGFMFDEGESPTTTVLARVDPDGSVHVAADELMFPNGVVITPDGKKLIVAETFASRLTGFDIAPDGSLSNRRVWATLPDGAVPDGICLDQEGAVWVASPTTKCFLRLTEGGEVLDRIETDQQAIACTLGGPDMRTLFLCTSEVIRPEACRAKMSARIAAVEVEVPGTGSP